MHSQYFSLTFPPITNEGRHSSAIRTSYGYLSWVWNPVEVCYLHSCIVRNIVLYCTAIYWEFVVNCIYQGELWVCFVGLKSGWSLWPSWLLYCAQYRVILHSDLSGVRSATVCVCIYVGICMCIYVCVYIHVFVCMYPCVYYAIYVAWRKDIVQNWKFCLHHLKSIKYMCIMYCCTHGPLTRYVKFRVAHASGMPGTFYPPPTSKETAS